MAILKRIRRLLGYEPQKKVYNFECQACGLDFQTESKLAECPHCGAHNAPIRDD